MKRRRHVVWLLIALLVAPPSAAIDLQPGDVQAPAPGIRIVQLSYQQIARADAYRDGERQPGDPRLRIDQAQLRLGGSFTIAGRPAFFYAQTPLVAFHPGGALGAVDEAAGLGDTALLLAIWPYANRETQRYLAIGAYLLAPTGDYHHDRRFNPGEHRDRAALQLGVQMPLTARARWMAAADVLWFGDNTAFGPARDRLAQAPLYSGQIALQYDLTPRHALAAGYFYTDGGETRLDGVERNDPIRGHRYKLTATANLSFGRLSLDYGADLAIENGLFEQSRWMLRYLKVFR